MSKDFYSLKALANVIELFLEEKNGKPSVSFTRHRELTVVLDNLHEYYAMECRLFVDDLYKFTDLRFALIPSKWFKKYPTPRPYPLELYTVLDNHIKVTNIASILKIYCELNAFPASLSSDEFGQVEAIQFFSIADYREDCTALVIAPQYWQANWKQNLSEMNRESK